MLGELGADLAVLAPRTDRPLALAGNWKLAAMFISRGVALGTKSLAEAADEKGTVDEARVE